VQALQVFLEAPGDLGSNMRWSGMLPASASVLEGAGKFSMQLIGRESRVRRQGRRLRQACLVTSAAGCLQRAAVPACCQSLCCKHVRHGVAAVVLDSCCSPCYTVH
jgi:hypothetical protein